MINTIMKIQEIINEDVDMSFWREKDALYNSDALQHIEKQEKRQALIRKLAGEGTAVFHKPARKSKGKFNNKPQKNGLKSAGWRGNVIARTHADILDPKTSDKLLNT
jgi:hypothetical protein